MHHTHTTLPLKGEMGLKLLQFLNVGSTTKVAATLPLDTLLAPNKGVSVGGGVVRH